MGRGFTCLSIFSHMSKVRQMTKYVTDKYCVALGLFVPCSKIVDYKRLSNYTYIADYQFTPSCFHLQLNHTLYRLNINTICIRFCNFFFYNSITNLVFYREKCYFVIMLNHQIFYHLTFRKFVKTPLTMIHVLCHPLFNATSIIHILHIYHTK